VCMKLYKLFLSDGFYLGAGFGKGNIDVTRVDFPGSDLLDIDVDAVIATELSVGYEFANNLGIDLSAGLYDTVEFVLFDFEEIDLNSVRLGVTYTLPTESNFQFYGRAGMNFWQVEITESGLGNPGPEDQVKQSDQDVFFQIGAEYRFNPRFRLGLAYDRTSTDFGAVDGIKLNLKFFP